jgi:hypothetical protein
MHLVVLLGMLLAQYQQYPGIYQDPRKTQPGSASQPMPAFIGKVSDVSDKRVTLEIEGGNLMEFTRTRKTEYYDGKEKIKGSVIKAGDRVTIETRKAPDGTLDAVIVRLERKPAKRDQ